MLPYRPWGRRSKHEWEGSSLWEVTLPLMAAHREGCWAEHPILAAVLPPAGPLIMPAGCMHLLGMSALQVLLAL